MRVLIPAGGRGMRLRPLTHRVPKPLLPLAGRPILTRILESLPERLPVDLLVTPDLVPHFEAWHGTLNGRRGVEVLPERPCPEGPRGPVAALAGYLDAAGGEEDLLILMGDSLLPFSLEEFLMGNAGSLRLAAYHLPDPVEAGRFGVVEIGPEGTAVSFEEKPARPRSSWVFSGCLYLPGRLRDQVGRGMQASHTQMGHLVSAFLMGGERVEVFCFDRPWEDIGTAEAYIRAHAPFLEDAARDKLRRAGTVLQGSVYVHPQAVVERSVLVDTIVQSGARVDGSRLTGCIVESGSLVTGRCLSGVLVSPRGEEALNGVS